MLADENQDLTHKVLILFSEELILADATQILLSFVKYLTNA